MRTSCSVEMTVKCAAPYSKEYQKGALERTALWLFPLPPASASGIVKRLATATPHSPPESFPVRIASLSAMPPPNPKLLQLASYASCCSTLGYLVRLELPPSRSICPFTQHLPLRWTSLKSALSVRPKYAILAGSLLLHTSATVPSLCR